MTGDGTSLDLGEPSDEERAAAVAMVRSAADRQDARASLELRGEAAQCLIQGCTEARVVGFHCQAHADWLVGRDTAAVRAIKAKIRADTMQRVAEGAARIVAERGTVEPTGQAAIVCPHCQTRGNVTSRRVRRKKGISGGKATGAILTGGLSMLGTGLSRKETLTEMYCRNCRTIWTV